ncbi:50S ribosomal protein L13 [Bienertia sinuspersici]
MKNQDHDKPQRFLNLVSRSKLLKNLTVLILYFLVFVCGIIIGTTYSTNIDIGNLFVTFKVINTTNSSYPPPLILSTTSSSPLPPPLWEPSSAPTFLHNMEDEQLLQRANSIAHKDKMNNNKTIDKILVSKPKIAFMFLVRGALPLGPLWDKFFRGYEGLYTIYVHASPLYNQTYPKHSVFHGRRIPSKEVQWGKFNMVEAERRLLANAVLDPLNQRFVLLSESCIPLFNFTTVYEYLINSSKSYVEVYDNKGPTGRGRYSSRMSPIVRIDQWRKGSQWFEMNRDLAIQVIQDKKYFPIFAKFCKHSCYGDEHYLPTYINIKFGTKNTNRTVTWVDWSVLGPHPGKYERPRVTPELLEKLRSEKTCLYNGKRTNICFLFARKFMPSSLNRLLMFSPKILKFG